MMQARSNKIIEMIPMRHKLMSTLGSMDVTIQKSHKFTLQSFVKAEATFEQRLRVRSVATQFSVGQVANVVSVLYGGVSADVRPAAGVFDSYDLERERIH